MDAPSVIKASVIYRTGHRLTEVDYLEAIDALRDGMSQLEPDGDNCHVCHDSGHQAWECHHNPLVMAKRAAQARAMEGTAIPWRCFHCSQVFHTVEDAREHFGKDADVVAECRRRYICIRCAGTGFTDLGAAANKGPNANQEEKDQTYTSS